MLQKQKLQHFVQYSLAQQLIDNANQGIEIDLNLLISILRSMDVAAGSINISAGEYHSFLDLELQRNNLIRIKDYPYKGGNCAFDSLGLHMHMMGHQQQIQLAQLHKMLILAKVKPHASRAPACAAKQGCMATMGEIG